MHSRTSGERDEYIRRGLRDKQNKPHAIYGDRPNFAWTNPEIDILRNLTVEQHRLLSKNSKDRTRSKQLCNIDGLQYRTFSALYSKVCKLRPVSQRAKRWTEPEDNIIRRITKEQQEAFLFLLNKRTSGKSAQFTTGFMNCFRRPAQTTSLPTKSWKGSISLRQKSAKN